MNLNETVWKKEGKGDPAGSIYIFIHEHTHITMYISIYIGQFLTIPAFLSCLQFFIQSIQCEIITPRNVENLYI